MQRNIRMTETIDSTNFLFAWRLFTIMETEFYSQIFIKSYSTLMTLI